MAAATSAISSSPCGRNSCSGGSSRRMVTGRPAMISNSSTKSARCIGSSLASAARRDFSSSARIISRTAWMRSSSKNMCSVRHSPMPSAPKRTAALASAGVSALARTPSLRTLSAQPISVANSPDSCGSIMSTLPASTWPVEPSTVMKSPFLKVCPPAVMVPAGIIDADRAGAGDAGLAHAARDHGGVRGHAAARGEDAFGGVHAVDVLRRGLHPHQDDLLAVGLELRPLRRTRTRSRPRPRRATPAGRWRSPCGARADRWSDAAAGRATSGSTRSTASSLVISPSLASSTAMRSAALAVRLPLRVCSIHSLPCSMVNSRSCMSR